MKSRLQALRCPTIPGHILAIILSLFTTFGKADLSSNSGLILRFAGWYLIYLLIWWLLQTFILPYSLTHQRGYTLSSKTVFWGSLLICLLCWTPYFLAHFPGILSSDSVDQLRQVVGDLAYSNHHPWLHTLFIGLLYRIGTIVFGSSNGGVALFILVQMILMASCYAYTIMTFYRHRIKVWFLILCLLFFAMMPFQAIYAITMWKDVLFSGVCLLFSVVLWQLITEEQSRAKWSACFFLGVLLCLLRSNGLYAYIFCLPFLLLGLGKLRKQFSVVAAATLTVVFLFKGPVMSAFHVTEPDMVESLSIPLQQIAGTIKAQGIDCLTPEEHAYLGSIMDLNKVSEVYFPNSSDNIKNMIRISGNQEMIAQNLGQFLKTYIQLGLRYPKEYITAYVYQTYGYWYPDVSYWVFIPEIHTNTLNITFSPLLSEKMYQIIFDSAANYTQIPVYQWLWRIGTYVWGMLVCFAITMHKKNWSSLLVFLPSIGLWLSLLVATPVYAEFRYAYSIIIAIPLFLALAGQSPPPVKQVVRSGL